MNIFIVDSDPEQAARALFDKHIVKMPLESTQIICTVLHDLGVKDLQYRPTHRNHPVVRWAGSAASNFDWLFTHARELCNEYERRYGRVHASRLVLVDAGHRTVNFPSRARTPFVQSMPEELRGPDAVEAYRRYYRYKIKMKPHLARWTEPGYQPDWLNEGY